MDTPSSSDPDHPALELRNVYKAFVPTGSSTGKLALEDVSLIVRLGYRRLADGVVSLHRVAPVDVRPGPSSRTAKTLYLWAFCYEESKLERHQPDQVVSVTVSEERFVPRDILAGWPQGWLIPKEWVVPRGSEDWDLHDTEP